MTLDGRQLNRSTRYHSLDLWRGVACLMVVVFHSVLYLTDNPAAAELSGRDAKIFRLIHWLHNGVPIFFVISGYCIAAACDALRDRPRAVRAYFTRRFRRIFPPYLVAVALLALATGALIGVKRADLFFDDVHPIPHPAHLSTGQWLGNLTLTETWRPNLVSTGAGPSVNGDEFHGIFLNPAWTLCYEEQFYAVCGLALFLFPRRFFTALLAITLAVAAVALLAHQFPARITGFFFDGRWLSFAMGVAVYYRVIRAKPAGARAIDAAMVVSCGVIAILHSRIQSQLTEELRTAAAFALVLIPLFRFDLPLSSARLLRPLRACGVMCYSLYLVHWPIVKITSHYLYLHKIDTPAATLLVTMPICVIASLLAGWTFFVLVERRFLNPPARAMTREQASSTRIPPSSIMMTASPSIAQ